MRRIRLPSWPQSVTAHFKETQTTAICNEIGERICCANKSSRLYCSILSLHTRGNSNVHSSTSHTMMMMMMMMMVRAWKKLELDGKIMRIFTRIAELTQSLDVAETGVWLDGRRRVTRTDSVSTEVIRLRERLQQRLHPTTLRTYCSAIYSSLFTIYGRERNKQTYIYKQINKTHRK